MARSSGRVTMQDVAKLAGVTARTVSNVVNDYPFVKEETRKRVWAAVDELGYTMNVSARGLKQGNTGLIALAIPDLTMPYFADLSDAVIAQAQKRGLSVLIEPTASNRQREKEALNRVRGSFGDGIIYCPLEIDPEELKRIDVGTPMVVLSEPEGNPRYDHVMIRNREAAEAATAHLISGGSRRIVALGLGAGQAKGPALQRLLGYRDALARYEITPDPRLEVSTHAWHRSDGVAAIDQLFDSNVAFDGVFAFTDQLASGALHSLQMHGMRIPQDVAVVGFDNNDESKYLVPSLTTIDPGIDEIADRAIEILSDRIAHTAPNERIVTQVDFRLVQRNSSRSA